MTDPEKKRRLEDIKRKRRELQEQLNQNEAKKQLSTKNAMQEAKEALDKASKPKVELESFEVVEQAAAAVSKYIKSKKAHEFKTVNFTEEFPAYKPELYDEGTQCYDEKEYDEEESDNEEKEQIQAKPRQQLIFPKIKQVKNGKEKSW